MKKKSEKQSQGMVDIGNKESTKRTATACAQITLSPDAFSVLLVEGSPKGNVFETAKIAGIMAAKSTPQIIPLCHPLELNKVNIRFETHQKTFMITVLAEVNCNGRTGVEMEALCAACVAALTIYDMMKFLDKGMVISEVKLLKKTGGKSGDFVRR